MSTVPSPEDRRVHLALRGQFESVFAVLEPYFVASGAWSAGASHEHLALRALQEEFPSLGAQDRFIALSAAKRLFAAGLRPQK